MELSHEKITLALPITRLTNIKSLCTDKTAAQNGSSLPFPTSAAVNEIRDRQFS